MLKKAKSSDAKQTRKIEYGQIVCTIIILVGIGSIVAYYWAIFAGFTPSDAVAVAGMTEILGGGLGYYIYQGKLKSSLNNNRLYIDNEGHIRKIKENDEDDN